MHAGRAQGRHSLYHVLRMDVGDACDFVSDRQDGRGRHWNKTVHGHCLGYAVGGGAQAWGLLLACLLDSRFCPHRLSVCSLRQAQSPPIPCPSPGRGPTTSSGSGLNDLRRQPQPKNRGSIQVARGGKGKGGGKTFCLVNGAISGSPGMGTTSGHSQRLTCSTGLAPNK